MANGIEVARAYVTIAPSMEGAQRSISEQMGAAADAAGASSGRRAGSGFGSGFGAAVMGAGQVIAGATAAVATGVSAATGALASFSVQGASYADNVLTMSTNTHIAADELQAYMYAAELVDVSTETMTSSMARNVRSMTSAADGTGAVAEAYSALGVAVTNSDGSLRDSQEVYWELIDALGTVEDDTTRDALAMQIFGRSAQDLNSLIAVGSEGMAEYAAQAQEAGAILNQDTLESFGAFDDTLQMLNSGVGAARNALGTVLLPVLTELGGQGVELLNQFSSGILAANGDISQMGNVASEIIPQFITVISDQLPGVLELGGSILSAIGDGIIANLDTILSSANSVVMEFLSSALRALPTLIEVGIGAIGQITQALLAPDMVSLIINSAIEVVLALLRGLTDTLPTLIPAAVEAIMTISETLLDPANLFVLIEAAGELIAAIVDGLIRSLPSLISGMGTIIDNIASPFENLGNMALTWAHDMIDNFVGGIRDKISEVTSAVTSVANTVRDYIGFSEPDKGPLSNFHTYAPDMIDLFNEGLEESTPRLEATLNRTLILPTASGESFGESYAPGVTTGGDIVIPVYIGQDRLDTIMLTSQQVATYRRGG